MFSCRDARRLMAQYVADGEPSDVTYQGLREHVATCRRCATQLEYLRAVETALRTMPRAVPSPELRRVLLEQALEELRLRRATKRGVAGQLGWDILAPLLTLLAALLITAQFLPADVWVAARQSVVDIGALSEPIPVNELLRGSPVGSGHLLFWAMWIATALVLCGFGLAWALSAWSEAYDRRLDELQNQVLAAADRLIHRT